MVEVKKLTQIADKNSEPIFQSLYHSQAEIRAAVCTIVYLSIASVMNGSYAIRCLFCWFVLFI